MEYDTLYQKSSKSKEIKVYKLTVKYNPDESATLIIEFGQKGKHLRTIKKEFVKSNNSKKKNISRTLDEARFEAIKLFKAKLKKGYIREGKKISNEPLNEDDEKEEDNNNEENNKDEEKEDAEDDEQAKDAENDDDKEEKKEKRKLTKKVDYKVYMPMLAYDYKKKSNCITFPCFCQAKLDGVRAVANTTRLTSRNGNEFPSLEHIKAELDIIEENIILDGELYTDDVNFEKIVSLVKKGKKTPQEEKESLKIYYNVFDCITDDPFDKRYETLKNLFVKYTFKYIKLVTCDILKTVADLEPKLDYYIKEGFEGIILRNKKGKYEQNTRSSQLQKLKRFIDDEFEIIDKTTPTNGKEVGCVIWICKTKEGKEFNVRPEGSYPERKKLYKEGKKHIGKMLTVRFQELTKDGIPRFPVGITIRDYEG